MEKTHPLWEAIDSLAFASKNLWNVANYHVRQSFIFHHTYLNNTAIFHLLKQTETCQALPAKASSRCALNVLAALVSNTLGFIPRLVSGGPVKAANQLYGKRREHAQKQLAKGKEYRFTSKRLDRITTKRNWILFHHDLPRETLCL